MLSRKITKKEILANSKYVGKPDKYLVCKNCKFNEVLVPADIGAVVCSGCVLSMVTPPSFPEFKKDKENNPRGWHLKKDYVSPSGRRYTYGKEVTNDDNPNEND